MYNEREKLFHHQQLHSPKDAAADLALLKRLKPTHPRLQEFGFSPSRCAGDILMALLDIVHRDDIVKNRLQFKQTPEPEPAPDSQELQEQIKEKEEEVADLQDQLDEKEDQIADLEEQLAEEKKSEENPAKKTAAKKSTAKKGGSKKK
jgi:septal ring factor EnvC (AmiA/AmiB activator)